MIKKLFLLLFLFNSVNVSAQLLTDTAHIDYTQYKGKLLVINEMHGVDANNTVYRHIIEEISTVALQGDTLNLIVERPYSMAYLMNKRIEGEYSDTTVKLPLYTNVLSSIKMPVKVIGVDFEYDGGKRGDAYISFLKNIQAKLADNGVAIEPLQKYIEQLRKDDKWQQPEGKKELIRFYQQELKAHLPGTSAYNSLNQLVFTLQAKYFITSRAGRDRVNYKRLIRAELLFLLQYKGKYNLLIHGAEHTDPTRRNNIYSHFCYKRTSPFYNNCFSIAQVYVQCLSKGDYFHKIPVTESSSIFTKHKLDKKLIDFVTNKYSDILPNNSITCFKKMALPLSLSSKKTSIKFWFIQWHTN